MVPPRASTESAYDWYGVLNTKLWQFIHMQSLTTRPLPESGCTAVAFLTHSPKERVPAELRYRSRTSKTCEIAWDGY